MGVSRLTAMMIQTNEVRIIETRERCEAWLVRNDGAHSLLLSCPLDKRSDMEDAIRLIREESEPQ